MPHVLRHLQGQGSGLYFSSLYLSDSSKYHWQNFCELSFQVKYISTTTFPSCGSQIPISHYFWSWLTECFHDLSPYQGVWLIVGFLQILVEWISDKRLPHFLPSVLFLVFKSTLFLLMKLSHSNLPLPVPLQRKNI